MEERDYDKLAELFVEKLDSKRNISKEKHERHHDFIETMILREKKKTETFEAVRLHVLKFGALSVMTALAIAAWQYIKAHLK